MHARLIIPLIVVTLVALGAGLAVSHDTPQDSSYSADVEKWRDAIRTLGATEAHDRFVEETNAGAIQRSHTEAHIFGAALYAEKGRDGIIVCDHSFAFGCLHEMYERIIYEHGIDDLKESVLACVGVNEAWHPCHHALGHGLVAYFGYDESAVTRALGICEEGFNDDPINGCVGGVFMEFNLYTTAGPDIEPREVGETGWFYPCTVIGEQHQRACYFWLPQWWRERMKNDGVVGADAFTELGRLCSSLPRPEFEQECFERVGQHATYASGYRPAEAKLLCDAATADPQRVFSCRSYSAFSFRYTDERFADEALEMCAGYAGERLAYCETFARNEANIGTAPPFPHESSF